MRAGALLCLVLLVSAPVQAQSPEGLVLDEERDAELEEEAERLLAELREVDDQLQAAEVRVRALTLQTERLEAQVAEARSRLTGLEQELSERQTYLARRLRALYMGSGERSFLRVLFSARSYHDARRHIRYLSLVVEQDGEVVSRYRELAAEREVRVEELATQRSAQLTALSEAEAARIDAQLARNRRADLLDQIQGEQRQRLAALAARERERELAGELPTERLAPGLGRPMASRRDLLFPARGHVSQGFGQRSVDGVQGQVPHNGIEIAAPLGSPVRACAGGRVTRVRFVNGFGNVVIIDHGGGWHSIYAHVDGDVPVVSGESVHEGQIIAQVSDSGSLTGPKLYFELRRERVPVDPLPRLTIPPGVRVP